MSKENRKSDMEMEIEAMNSPRLVVVRLPLYTGNLSDFGRTFWAEVPASWLTPAVRNQIERPSAGGA